MLPSEKATQMVGGLSERGQQKAGEICQLESLSWRLRDDLAGRAIENEEAETERV